MEFINPSIEAYAEAHTTPENNILEELNRETLHKVLQPRMLSGHLQGRVLSMLSQIHRPKKILEIGTYTGYSALCLAEGLAEDGELHTIDRNEELYPMVERYIQKAGLEQKIKMHTGNAINIIPQLNHKWDLIFIDADKENYVNYYNLLIDHVNPGGLIVVDNVLWSGKVLDTQKNADEETVVLDELNKILTNDVRVENVLLPIRDGLMVAKRVSKS